MRHGCVLTKPTNVDKEHGISRMVEDVGAQRIRYACVCLARFSVFCHFDSVFKEHIKPLGEVNTPIMDWYFDLIAVGRYYAGISLKYCH